LAKVVLQAANIKSPRPTPALADIGTGAENSRGSTLLGSVTDRSHSRAATLPSFFPRHVSPECPSPIPSLRACTIPGSLRLPTVIGYSLLHRERLRIWNHS